MRLSISNIAWDADEDEQVADLLKQHGIDAIDVAPGKYFSDIPAAKTSEIHAVRDQWRERGFEIVGMQALLFGTQGLNLFGDASVQARMLDHLGHVCRIGHGLGAKRLTFGSPKNRDRSGLSDLQAEVVAVDFFTRLAWIALEHDVTICLEPNPSAYGCNFMTTTRAAAAMVEKIDHPNIRLQLDTGAMAMNDEDAEIIREVAPLVGHIHLSEPNLLPLGDGETKHAPIASFLIEHLGDHTATIEMVATKDESHLASVARALQIANSYYYRSPIVGSETMRPVWEETEKKLSAKDAFYAMRLMLDYYWNITQNEELGLMLSDLQVDGGSGQTFDPAAWQMWMENIEKVLRKDFVYNETPLHKGQI